MGRYGKEIRWQSEWSGAVTTVTADNCETMEEAEREALKMALDRGWRPPKWWEFWRWGEPEIDVAVLNTVEKPILPG